LISRRHGDRVRLFTRRGFDWSNRYPRIVTAMAALKVASATIDGEAVWCDEDGVSDFEKVHGCSHDHQDFLYAFDLLHLDGVDLREAPLIERKAKLAKLTARAPDGIRYSEHLEGDGATIFEHVCKLGLEGIVGFSAAATLQPFSPSSATRISNSSKSSSRILSIYTWSSLSST
jgi:bifunctional non-homologous end joining protein LigD